MEWYKKLSDNFGNVECLKCGKTMASTYKKCIFCCTCETLEIYDDYDDGLSCVCKRCGIERFLNADSASGYVLVRK